MRSRVAVAVIRPAILSKRVRSGANSAVASGCGLGQALEVQRQRSDRARILGRLSTRLSKGDRCDGSAKSALVHRAGGQQVVHRVIVVEAMIEALEALDLRIPASTEAEEAALEAARRKLESEV